jgi:hypothetical protein
MQEKKEQKVKQLKTKLSFFFTQRVEISFLIRKKLTLVNKINREI